MNKKLLIPLLLCFSVFISCSGEKKDWKNTESENSITAYEDYLKQYPQGKFADEARSRIETIHFEKAETANTIEAYDDFLKRYAEGDFADKARSKIEAIYFDQAKAANSIEAYEDFLKRYPEGELADSVQLILKKIQQSFSKEKVLKIKSISNYVGDGNILFEKGKEPNTLNFEINGVFKSFGDINKICYFCVKTIRIAPNLRVPIYLFNKKGFADIITRENGNIRQNYQLETVTVAGKTHKRMKSPPVVDSVELDPLIGKIKFKIEATEFIVSGPQGTTLKKEGNGFRLIEGEARLIQKNNK